MSTNIIGKTLLNQFRVDAFVASGGMGAVYRVWDLKRNVPLAMKVLHSELAEDPAVFKRFQREANALKKLAHPNIVPFYGLYQSHDFAFLLERFIDGPSLKDILRQQQGKPLSVSDALVYLKALCAALGYAHANGVVHCDVKPGNVMVDQGGNIYLADFGIARHAESTTTTMGAAGTPAYMAPEQIRGEVVSPATDVYALGVMLFEMLTGQRPFRGTEAGTEKGGTTANERIRYGQLNLAPPDPRGLKPGLPIELSTLLLKALSKQPESRFASTQALFIETCAAAGSSPGSVAERIMVQNLSAQQSIISRQIITTDSGATVVEVQRGGLFRWPAAGFKGIILAGILVTVMLAGGIYAIPRVIRLITNPKTPAPLQPMNPANLSMDELATVPFPSPETPVPTPTYTPTDTPSPTATITPYTTPVSGSILVSKKDNMNLVFVPAGEFVMGSSQSGYDDEKPEHEVFLDDYWIDQTEVTNAMFTRFVDETGYVTDLERAGMAYTWNGGGWTAISDGSWKYPYGNSTSVNGRENYPVIQVSWNDADAYCNWAGRRLPTEAEWEKAARGPDGNIYPWGNSSPSRQLANYGGLIGDLTSVGSFQTGISDFGAFDMGGNVMEWVADWYAAAYYSASPYANPPGPSPSKHKVMRGGSWQLGTLWLSGYNREVSTPGLGNNNLGFRCAKDANP